MHKCNVNVLLINFSFFIINIADDTGKKKTSFNTETLIPSLSIKYQSARDVS